jgi:hypothetical protein
LPVVICGLVAFGEVDVDGKIAGIGSGLETPVTDGLLCRCAEEGVAGLDLCVGDGAIGLNGKVHHNGATYVHAPGEFGIDGRDFVDDGSTGAGGVGQSGSQREGA